MKEDIKAKMRQQQRQGGGSEVKVELVGVPSFMMEQATEASTPNTSYGEIVEKPWKNKKPKAEAPTVIQGDNFVVMAPPVPRKQWGQGSIGMGAEK